MTPIPGDLQDCSKTRKSLETFIKLSWSVSVQGSSGMEPEGAPRTPRGSKGEPRGFQMKAKGHTKEQQKEAAGCVYVCVRVSNISGRFDELHCFSFPSMHKFMSVVPERHFGLEGPLLSANGHRRYYFFVNVIALLIQTIHRGRSTSPSQVS